MKKLSTLVFILLVSFCFIFAGCSSAPLNMPTNYTKVTSNGGFVVGAGNYLYFANAYQSYENLKSKEDNDGAGVKQYSLKRVQTENNKDLKLDDEQNIVFENVLNKIAGYETSNMYVVGEYLYFTSPNVHKSDSKEQDKYNQYEFELSTLFRIKLDGSNLSEIYTTETSTAKFYLTGGNKQSILIYDDEKILQVKCFENSTKVNTLAENVKSTVFPYDQGLEFVNIYFTTSREEDSKLNGNILNKLNLVTGETKEVQGYSNNNETITLISYNGERLFYTRTGVESRKGLYFNDFSNGLASELKRRYDTDSFNATSKIYIIKTAEDYDVDAFVFEYNNNIWIQDIESDNDSACEKLTSESSTISFVDGTYVYFTTENGIYRVSVLTKTIEQISDVKDFNADKIDFDGRFLYFYAKVDGATTDTKYLYRADTKLSLKTECIAELLEEDIKEESEIVEE